MALGPCWRSGSPSPPTGSALAEQARAIGLSLADALDRARWLSGDWSAAALAQPLVERAMSCALARLAALECWGRENEGPSHAFWDTAQEYLQHGWLQARARAKPCGYAGDYLMLAALVEQTVCQHPLGRLLDRYFLDQAAPQAVRSRTQQIAATLVSRVMRGEPRPVRIASVVAGPALDVAAAAACLPAAYRKQLAIVLLDLDDAALAFAARRLEPWIVSQQLTLKRDNLYRLAARAATAELLVGSDTIICSGFFDYLPDQAACEMLALFWRCLAPEGQLLVGNFAPHCPTRAYMEWIGNWYLIYRTPDELLELAQRAAIPAEHSEVGAERLGVDLFLTAARPPSSGA